MFIDWKLKLFLLNTSRVWKDRKIGENSLQLLFLIKSGMFDNQTFIIKKKIVIGFLLVADRGFVDEQANVLVSASEIDIPNYSQAQIK